MKACLVSLVAGSLACAAACGEASVASSQSDLVRREAPNPRTAERVVDSADLAPKMATYWCPRNAQFDTEYRLCVAGAEVVGPFSEAMKAACVAAGGGDKCAAEHWDVRMARELRGKGLCQPGTQFDEALNVCASGNEVFGPFTIKQVDTCRKNRGGSSCESLHFPKSFLTRPSNGGDRDAVLSFRLPEPANTGKQLQLWATYYFLPVVDSIGDGIPLRDMKNAELGPRLSPRDWCTAAMEGSVFVKSENGGGKTYNYAGTADGNAVDCSAYFSHNVSRSKFMVAKGVFGDGVNGFQLMPYRTIAVDKKSIPYGSVIYIPEARGMMIDLPDGRRVAHDGYFFAGDTGGLIKGNHIDVYIATAQSNPFSWIKSKENGKFSAYLVADPDVVDALASVHISH